MAQTIQEALGSPEWYGAERVAFLNCNGDLVLQHRARSFGDARRQPPTTVRRTEVITGSDAEKIRVLAKFRSNLKAVS